MKKGANYILNILNIYIRNIDLFIAFEGIDGGIYKLQRPINSVKEDIVTNVVSMDGGDVQEGVANINIYVPNLELNIDGMIDNSQPNTERLTELEELALADLSEFWAADGSYAFELEWTRIESDNNNQHYINIRIRFYSPSI